MYRAELWLNNDLVYEWEQPDPELYPLCKSLKVMFDSSHYQYGTPVEVTFKVWGTETGMHEIESDPDPLVKNRLMMYEDPDSSTPDPVPTVSSIMSGRNYSFVMDDSPNWTKDTYLASIEISNAVFFAGHGTDSSHSAATGPGLTPGLYETAQIGFKGTGLPPFNSTDSPSVNFCHLTTCNCGDTSDFKTALYPYYMGWGGPYLENQALMAHTAFSATQQRWKNAELIWEKIAKGWTARYVHDWMQFTWLPDNAGVIKMSDLGGDPAIWRDMVIADLALFSGPDNGAMRLKTVYR